MIESNDWSRIAQSEPLTFLSSLDNTPQPYALAMPHDAVTGEPVDPRGLVIYLHGHGSNWQQGFFTDTYGGAFGRLHTEVQQRHLAFATLDYRGTASWMSPAAEADLTQLIELLSAQLGTNRLYLAGGSMGGSSALAYATQHPAWLRGVIAICPATDIGDFYTLCRSRADSTSREITDAIEVSYAATPATSPALFENRSALKNHNRLTMPVVLVHGTADALIPVTYSRELYAKLQEDGACVDYHEIDGGDHDAPVIQADWGRYLDFLESY